MMKPYARKDNLLVQGVGDDLVIYDQCRHQAHSLNRTAALVWKACDGKKTVAEIATLLAQELNAPHSEELTWNTLAQLEKACLLREAAASPASPGDVSRRQAIHSLGLKGAAALLPPVVTSLVAPTPAMASSGYRFGNWVYVGMENARDAAVNRLGSFAAERFGAFANSELEQLRRAGADRGQLSNLEREFGRARNFVGGVARSWAAAGFDPDSFLDILDTNAQAQEDLDTPIIPPDFSSLHVGFDLGHPSFSTDQTLSQYLQTRKVDPSLIDLGWQGTGITVSTNNGYSLKLGPDIHASEFMTPDYRFQPPNWQADVGLEIRTPIGLNVRGSYDTDGSHMIALGGYFHFR